MNSSPEISSSLTDPPFNFFQSAANRFTKRPRRSFTMRTVSLLATLVFLACQPAHAAVVVFSTDFNSNDGGFTAAVTSGSTSNPFTYSTSGGIGGVGDGAWINNGVAASSQKTLTSPAITVPANGDVTIQFSHRFRFEAAADGGQLQVSINGGAFSTVTSGSFSLNGYNGTSIIGSSWSGTSSGYTTPSYITSSATLVSGATAGDEIRFRFRAGWDSSVVAGSPNWVIDNISVSAVPEPSHVAVAAGLALVAFAGFRRVRKKA